MSEFKAVKVNSAAAVTGYDEKYNLNDAEYILSLPQTQVKVIRNAIRILCRAGFLHAEATSMVIERHRKYRRF